MACGHVLRWLSSILRRMSYFLHVQAFRGMGPKAPRPRCFHGPTRYSIGKRQTIRFSPAKVTRYILSVDTSFCKFSDYGGRVTLLRLCHKDTLLGQQTEAFPAQVDNRIVVTVVYRVALRADPIPVALLQRVVLIPARA